MKMKDRTYIFCIVLVFILMVMVLFYSYVNKLGYLNIATWILLGLSTVLCLINSAVSKNSARLFWGLMAAGFCYVIADKFFRVHILIADSIPLFMHSTVLVNGAYVFAFFIFLIAFRSYLYRQFDKSPAWLYLLLFATLLKLTAIATDIMFKDITEDYFEVFSLYFYASSFLIYLWRVYENRYISSGS